MWQSSTLPPPVFVQDVVQCVLQTEVRYLGRGREYTDCV